jgi:L-asparaginase / beta-aspartyl-peptidase
MLLIVHGGAGFKKPSKKALGIITLALSSGYRLLTNGANAGEAVLHSIKILEDSGVFNAGSGGNLQADGRRRLDASLMEGKNLHAGSVINLEGIRNPILAAKLIMESPHVVLTNKGAHRIAIRENLTVLAKPDEHKLKKLERSLKSHPDFFCFYQKYFSTVGAVALDLHGNLATGSSTGGIYAMLPGRVGDTPLIGAGIYADNESGAVSCTGIGEYIIRLSLAKEIVMRLSNLSPGRAVTLSLRRLLSLGGEAGVIAINRREQFCITHTTDYMPSGYAAKKGIFVKDSFSRIHRMR